MPDATSRRERPARALLLFALCGCIPLHASIQDAQGEAGLLLSRRPISEVIADPRTKPLVRGLLAQVEKVKRFGEQNGLTATSNYRSYVELRGPAVVYVVSASAPLRFAAKTWSFPIAGTFPYLGWFDRGSAVDYARDLAGEGWDVDVRGAAAYSTLGFFEDPVLSSMLASGPEALGDLADVVLHESVHATLHVEGQAPFNESLASFVADRLAAHYLDRARGPQSIQRRAWDDEQARSREATRELHAAYLDLKALYDGPLPDAEKLRRKTARLTALQEKLAARAPITNATLQQYETYNSGGSGFERLLASCAGDFRCFFARLRTLSPRSFSRPQQENLDPVLLPLSEKGGHPA